MSTTENIDITILRDPAAYLCFEHSVQEKNRYIHDQYTERFLIAVFETSKNREVIFPKDKVFWRARLGCEKSEGIKYHGLNLNQKDIPYAPEKMKPVAGRAKEGRANPKGIPCLYLATDMRTAIQEIRPWLNKIITVTEFRIIRDLKIVDCSKYIHKLADTANDRPVPHSKKEETLSECEERTWSWIDRAFSRPVDPSDDSADYVPTRILAELFRHAGYDGIIYNSLLAEGKNVALFNLNSAEPFNGKVHKVTNIPPFEFQEICQ
jgi:hypothetical protein